MKNFRILLASLFVMQFATAQKGNQENFNTSSIAIQKAIVKQALMYNDAQTAINSMHTIIALEGSASTYKDSLVVTYFNVGNYISSHLLAKELLEKKPENLQLLEINAASLQNLNAPKEAIAAYEILFPKTKNMAHGYQLAMLQYSIKRLAEAQVNIAQTLACDPLEKAFLQFPVDNKKNQQVPLKAAAYNLQGIIAFELKDKTAASNAFNEALKIMPEFATATQNANALTVEIQNEKKKN